MMQRVCYNGAACAHFVLSYTIKLLKTASRKARTIPWLLANSIILQPNAIIVCSSHVFPPPFSEAQCTDSVLVGAGVNHQHSYRSVFRGLCWEPPCNSLTH